MAGLGLFLYGALRTICGIGQAVENNQAKQTTYTLPNGKRYYYDRTGKSRLMDGTIIVYQGDKWIDTNYNVVCDNDEIKQKKEAEDNKKDGKLTYYAYSKLCEQRAVFEVSTGRIVAKIQRDYDGTCRKWYFYDNTPDLYPNVDPKMRKFYGSGHPYPYTIRKDDKGIIISTEEFEQLKKEFEDDRPWDRKQACYFYDYFSKN